MKMSEICSVYLSFCCCVFSLLAQSSEIQWNLDLNNDVLRDKGNSFVISRFCPCI